METNICKLKFRRGIEADRKTITPEEGEPIFTTDTHRFCIGDGKTLGGITFPKLYVGDDSNAVPGDLAYKDENLWLHTSDTDSVAIGGTQSIKVGDGVEIDNNKLTVKPASGISVDASGVSVNVGYIKDSVGITEIGNRINTLSANAIVSPLAPLYNTSTIYAYTANAKVPLKIDDTGLTPVTSVVTSVSGAEVNVDVYMFASSAIDIAKNVPDVTHVGINDGCVLNFDNTIKFDYSPTTYIQGYSTSVDDEYNITTYTLSTVKVEVPVFSVAGTKPDIADGSITEAMIADGSITEVKLSQEVQNKLNAGPDIADGSITNVKLKDSTITTNKLANGSVTTDKLADGCVTEDKIDDNLKSKISSNLELSDLKDYIIDYGSDKREKVQSYHYFNNAVSSPVSNVFADIYRWYRKYKSGWIEQGGYIRMRPSGAPYPRGEFGSSDHYLNKIDFLIPFSNLDYNFLTSYAYWDGSVSRIEYVNKNYNLGEAANRQLNCIYTFYGSIQWKAEGF